MLKQIHGALKEKKSSVAIRQAKFPRPFVSGLEFNAPVHGTWNIVHTGMLVPEAHQIYSCAINCNRGVVMTAAEMGSLDRFSTITIEEKDILFGNLEKLMLDGVTDILERLPYRPRMILLFPSCIQHFIGTNMNYVYDQLEARFPDITFGRCWMDPTMQRHALPPECRLRRELYAGLKPQRKNHKSVNILGNNLKLEEDCELKELLVQAGCVCRELAACKTYDEYEKQSESYLNLVTQPVALHAARALEKRLGMKYLYLPQCYGYEEIEIGMRVLAEEMGIAALDYTERKRKCDRALAEAKREIGDAPVAIDYTFTPRPLGLARLLLEHGFCVKRMYLDVMNGEEETDYKWLQEYAGELMVTATVHYQMRVRDRKPKETYLALGQKAAYFTDTPHFVNKIEGGGMYGYAGICRLAKEMSDAWKEEKDTREIVPKKGLGGACIL